MTTILPRPINADETTSDPDPREVFRVRMRKSVFDRARQEAKKEGVPIGKILENCVEAGLG